MEDQGQAKEDGHQGNAMRQWWSWLCSGSKSALKRLSLEALEGSG